MPILMGFVVFCVVFFGISIGMSISNLLKGDK